jgi:DnaJ family protein A protein 2
MGGMGGFGGIPCPFFGGGGGPQHNVKQARGPNKLHEIGVSMSDLYYGKTLPINIKREVLCATCNGSGGKKHETCGSCSGRGVRMRAQQMGPIMSMSQEPCDVCQQTGRKILEKCGECVGRRVTETTSTLNVMIEPGMNEGDRIVFAGQCSESPMFEAPGDVILVIRAATTDPVEWSRAGADLTTEIRLTWAEAMLGWERRFESHPSGHPLHLVWNGGPIRDGEVLRVPTWGMPVRGSKSGEKGDVRILCRIIGEQKEWTEEQMRALRSVWPEWREPVATESSVRPTRPAHP